MIARLRLWFAEPRNLGIVAATLATMLGIVVMAAGGAPRSYLILNAAALIIGMALLGIVVRSRGDNAAGGGIAMLAAATAILATTLFGTTIEETTRWARIGVVSLQPGLILLPLMITTFARTRDAAGTIAMVIAAAALALQPDRAMAGALAAGLAMLVLHHRERRTVIALAAALAAFAATMVKPDSLPATPFVEQVFADALAFSPLAGAAALAGAALLLLPVLACRDAAMQVFAAVWLAILVAAALGNYPTPLLGYGGSGILGYLLCLAALPSRQSRRSGIEMAARPRPRDHRGDFSVAAH